MFFELIGHLVLHLLGKRLHNTAIAHLFTGLGRILGVVALTIFAVAAGNIALKQRAELGAFPAQGIRAQATITDKTATSPAPRRAPAYRVSYAFETSGGQAVTSTTTVGQDVYNSVTVGERTPITYDPGNPQRSQPGTYRFDFTWFAGACVATLLFVVMALGRLAWFLPHQHGERITRSSSRLMLPRLVRLVIALAIAGYVGRLSWTGWEQEKDLVRNGTVAEATIDQRWIERSNLNPGYRVAYTVRTRDGRDVSGEASVHYASFLRLAPGTRTQAYYAAGRPNLTGLGAIPRTQNLLVTLSSATLAAVLLALWEALKINGARRERRRLEAARNEIMAGGLWNQPVRAHQASRTVPASGRRAKRSQVVERVPSLMHRIFG